VSIRELVARPDGRGVFFEFLREEWPIGFKPVQWNSSFSNARVLRGVHVHGRHFDYLVLLSGVLLLGLHDLRRESPTHGLSCLVTMEASAPRAITVPPGVCHDFYFPVASVYVNGVSSYWDTRDELGCRFDAPELNIQWPDREPVLSDRDRQGGSYASMLAAYTAWREALAAEEKSG
jgi:dTDP-4-dehydrorhamnose 3,5-epimerase